MNDGASVQQWRPQCSAAAAARCSAANQGCSACWGLLVCWGGTERHRTAPVVWCDGFGKAQDGRTLQTCWHFDISSKKPLLQGSDGNVEHTRDRDGQNKTSTKQRLRCVYGEKHKKKTFPPPSPVLDCD